MYIYRLQSDFGIDADDPFADAIIDEATALARAQAESLMVLREEYLDEPTKDNVDNYVDSTVVADFR